MCLSKTSLEKAFGTGASCEPHIPYIVVIRSGTDAGRTLDMIPNTKTLPDRCSSRKFVVVDGASRSHPYSCVSRNLLLQAIR